MVFPAIAGLAAGTSKTVNFNFTYPYFPVNSLTVAGPYTFTGNAIAVTGLLATTNSYTIAFGPTVATFLNAGLWVAGLASGQHRQREHKYSSHAGNATGFQLNHSELGLQGRGPARL